MNKKLFSGLAVAAIGTLGITGLLMKPAVAFAEHHEHGEKSCGKGEKSCGAKGATGATGATGEAACNKKGEHHDEHHGEHSCNKK